METKVFKPEDEKFIQNFVKIKVKAEKKRIIKIINKMKIWKSSNEKINERLKYYNQALEELKEELEAE